VWRSYFIHGSGEIRLIMTQSFYIISWMDVLVSFVLIALSIGLIRWMKIGLEQSLIIGTIRTFLQLGLMGYVLTWFFTQDNWLFMVCLILGMILIAGFEGTRRQKEYKIPHLFWILTGSILTAVLIVLGIILKFILDVEPWFYPYAMIPIAGMIIGNALNSSTLAVNRFIGEMKHREHEIEMLLSLGASPRNAIDDAMKSALRAALLPNINGLMMVGLVQLPGVMTGQILSGVDPLIAVRYQIMIMYMWISTVAITDILVLLLVYRQFFTEKAQLKKSLLRSAL
ncbi:MAG: iron export ABC transporter permease subunit FetB, partial [Candidatus Marinimicrobia bacterium]|nr:iron export ABC transporter permease subunit FetB [Candidatus Neomarinimicrobiota bacterium]